MPDLHNKEDELGTILIGCQYGFTNDGKVVLPFTDDTVHYGSREKAKAKLQAHIEQECIRARTEENQRYIDLADEYNNRKPKPGELTAASFGSAGAGMIASSYYNSFKDRIAQLAKNGGER